MPRQARVAVADTVYHVINRANGRQTIFTTDKEYQHFELLLEEAKAKMDMRILAYCIMPNHWHLILYPRTHTQLAEFMNWLTTTHVRQYRTQTNTIGYGHLYQDRYKSFPVQSNEYCTTLVRYVEQNPLRAKLVRRAEHWRWSSLFRRQKGTFQEKKMLSELPIDLPHNYLGSVNELLKDDTLAEVRYAVNKGKPYGTNQWLARMLDRFELSHTLRGAGRPRK